MKNFRAFVKVIYKFFTGFTVLVVILFAGVFIYKSNPNFLKSDKVSAENWMPKDVEKELNWGFMPKDVKYGYQLIAETSKHIGPMAKDPAMRYAGNNLACANCHLKAGTQAGSASWVGVVQRFPQFRGRSNSEGTIEDRVNGCMQRSMNGKMLPKESREMKSIVAYMDWLGENLPKEREKEFKGFPKLEIPDVAVDLEKGKAVFVKECAVCHGENGQGQRFADSTKGYQYPPLWGEDSYNNGAGMNRVITAAEFIKGNMPFGQSTWDNPKLTDEEAYHVAGYINSFLRPEKPDLEKDYPDLKLKPVSTPYGPWADNFAPEQHKFGPFQPIMKFYEQEYGITKSK